MTPRERILATLNRQAADRAPIDIWCAPEALESLKTHTGKTDELEVYRALGIDKLLWIFPGYGDTTGFDPNDSGEKTIWGVRTKKVRAGAATYQEYADSPLGDFEEPAQLDTHKNWPDPEKFNLAAAKQLARRAREYDFATIGPWISHFEIYCQLRGLENALMDIVVNPDFLDATLDRIDAIQTRMLEKMLVELRDELDVVFISDDMASQGNLLLSLPAWDRHFKPRLTRWCELIHAHGKKVLYHSDGAVLPLIPRLIEAGIDILNPIQHICEGMDMASLKTNFGRHLVFHGGVDNQSILPRGTPADVITETQNCLKTLGADGGYICCSCHNIQAGTPVENILAMIETARAARV